MAFRAPCMSRACNPLVDKPVLASISRSSECASLGTESRDAGHYSSAFFGAGIHGPSSPRIACTRNSIRFIRSAVKRSPQRLKYTSSGKRKVDEVVYIKVDPSGYDAAVLHKVIDMIKDGAVGIIPTDTVYAIVCDLKNREAVERLYRVKNMDPKKPLSILCRSMADIDTYTLGFPRGNSQGQTNVFRAVKQSLPGPYTFILSASKEMPKQCISVGSSKAFCNTRRSVGVRIPDDPICQSILSQLDRPLLCTSVTQKDEKFWIVDPSKIFESYAESRSEIVDFIVDGGVRIADPSTVVDMTGSKPQVLRQGKGEVDDWMIFETHDSTENRNFNPYKSD